MNHPHKVIGKLYKASIDWTGNMPEADIYELDIIAENEWHWTVVRPWYNQAIIDTVKKKRSQFDCHFETKEEGTRSMIKELDENIDKYKRQADNGISLAMKLREELGE